MESQMPANIAKLLQDLQDKQDYVRKVAAQQLREVAQSDVRIVHALEVVAKSDNNKYVRDAAVASLRAPVHQTLLQQTTHAPADVPITTYNSPPTQFDPFVDNGTRQTWQYLLAEFAYIASGWTIRALNQESPPRRIEGMNISQLTLALGNFGWELVGTTMSFAEQPSGSSSLLNILNSFGGKLDPDHVEHRLLLFFKRPIASTTPEQ
jgi:hypothetical protein